MPGVRRLWPWFPIEVRLKGMRVSESTSQRFSPRDVVFAGLGFASLIFFGVGIAVAFGPGGAYGRWLFISSPVLGAAAIVLNIRGLRRIRQGLAGEDDLIWTWPGLFSALLACLLSSVLILG
jgi:hypothetical protein